MTNVDYQVEDSVGLIRLDRPEKLNAFTFEMIARNPQGGGHGGC